MTGPSPLQTLPPGQPTPRTQHSPAASAPRSWLTIPAPRASDSTAQISLQRPGLTQEAPPRLQPRWPTSPWRAQSAPCAHLTFSQ